MKEWLARLKEKPAIAHVLRAVERYNNRLGGQFGAAITYFSVLAIIPIMLFAFAALGFVLTVLRPDLIDDVTALASGALGGLDPATEQKINDLISSTLSNWKGVGIVALISAIYSGAGWMGNLKNAVRAQWRPDFDLQEAQGNIVKKTLVNLLTLVGLLVLIAITAGLASLSTNLSDAVVNWLGLNEVGWLQPVLQFAPVVISIGAGWLLFMYLYTVLPEDRQPWRVVRRGALIGAIGLGLLQYSAGLLFNLFSNNKAAAIFGPVIVLMLVLNVFAQLILFVSAWIATATQEAVAVPEEKVRFALTPEADQAETAGEPGPAASANPPVMIPQPVAVRSVQVGLGAGYVTGAATGVGLGAALAWLVAKTVRGRR